MVKRGKYECFINVNSLSDFIIKKEIDLRENLQNEFKQLNSMNSDLIISYICGYLNSFGGTLLIGIKDDGFI